MRPGMRLAIACLLVVAGRLPAQEQIPLPPPDGGLPAAPIPATQPNNPNVPNFAPPGAQPQPYPAAPAQTPPPPPPPQWANPPFPVPPAPYGPVPYIRPPFVLHDPNGDPQIWVGFEGLVWFSKNQPLPIPVVTTGPASQGYNAGNLGMPGTTSLDGKLNYGVEGGFRMYAGGWFDSDHSIGVDGSFFILGNQSAKFGVFDTSGNGSLVINEPVNGSLFTTLVSAPGIETGGVIVNASSSLGGADFNLKYNLYRANGWTINLLGGYRYVELDEKLTITANSNLFTTTTFNDSSGNVLATAGPGSTITMVDQFGTKNQFNGGQIGSDFQYLLGRWIFRGAAKLGIGDMHEVVNVNGYTNVFPSGGNPISLIGGNYATIQIGRYSNDQFALVPEGQLSVGYAITPWISSHIGYNFLFLSNVVRPGDQIDNSYNGINHPNVPMATSTFWSQGLTLSLQFQY